jgi:hypothetical protein
MLRELHPYSKQGIIQVMFMPNQLPQMLAAFTTHPFRKNNGWLPVPLMRYHGVWELTKAPGSGFTKLLTLYMKRCLITREICINF